MDGGMKRMRRLRYSEKRLERLSRIWPEERPRECAARTDAKLIRQAKKVLLFGGPVPVLRCFKGPGAKAAAAAMDLARSVRNSITRPIAMAGRFFFSKKTVSSISKNASAPDR